MKFPACLLALMGGMLGFAWMPEAESNLVGYVQRPEPQFAWSMTGDRMQGSIRIVTLKMRSQVWRGIPWEHQIQIFVPREVSTPRTALLLVTGGDPDPSSAFLAMTVAPRLKAPLAVLYNIPNQPLFDGKSEDDLIAHTFQEYLADGDESWPLLFPMVKSAMKAMDAIQEYTRKEWPVGVREFVVTGASKRGWTTYLTGAADRRVKGIAPMVFDNLNFSRQMPRQLELWGAYSEQIQDYTRRGLQQRMDTPRGRRLVEMVDPYAMRDRLTMPKLLIHGANDRYWATDATRNYWGDLRGSKYLLTVPNGGHGLGDQERVVSTMTAFFQGIATNSALPRVEVTERLEGDALRLAITSSVRPEEVRIWTATAPDADFRPAKWQDQRFVPSDKDPRTTAFIPGTGSTAVFVECLFKGSSGSFTLSTPTRLYGVKTAAAQ